MGQTVPATGDGLVTGRPLPAGTFSSDKKGDFRVLRQHPSFPSAATEALKALGQSMHFRGGQAEPYHPSFAYWPTSGGVLVARISDAGRDAMNRPHRLQIDGVWIEEPVPASLDMAGLLSEDAWPDSVPDDDAIAFFAAPPLSGVETAVAAGGRVLVATTDELIASDFETRLGPGTILTPRPKLLPAVDFRSTTRLSQWSPILAAILLVSILGIGIAWYADHTKKQRMLTEREAVETLLRGEISSGQEREELLKSKMKVLEQRGPASREDLQEKFTALQRQVSAVELKMEMLSQRSDVQRSFDDLQKKLDALTAYFEKILVKNGIPFEPTKQTTSPKLKR